MHIVGDKENVDHRFVIFRLGLIDSFISDQARYPALLPNALDTTL